MTRPEDWNLKSNGDSAETRQQPVIMNRRRSNQVRLLPTTPKIVGRPLEAPFITLARKRPSTMAADMPHNPMVASDLKMSKTMPKESKIMISQKP